MTVDLINKQYIFNVNIDSNGNQTVNADIVSKQLIVSVDVFKGGKGDKGDKGEDGIDGTDGQDGQDLTLSDFDASQEVSTLEETDEFFIKRGEEFKRITKENLLQKSDTFHFIITSTGAVNRWFLHNNNQGTFSSSFQTNNGNIVDIINKPYAVSVGRMPAGKKIKSVQLYITYHTTVFGSNKIRLIIFVKEAVNNINYDTNVSSIILYDKLITPSGYLKTLYNVDNEIDDIEIPDGYYIQWVMNFEMLASSITIYNSAVIVNYK